MPRRSKSPERRGRSALLTSIGRDIAGHEAALVDLRQTREKLIRQDERGKCKGEIDYLRDQLAVMGWDVELEFNKVGL